MNRELIQYLVRYYSGVLSGAEQLLIKHAKTQPTLTAETLEALLRQIGWISDSADAGAFFTGTNPICITTERFDELIAAWILQEHRHQVFLNHCPICGQLARTPHARQCRHGHRW